jgi:hypothetical protein
MENQERNHRRGDSGKLEQMPNHSTISMPIVPNSTAHAIPETPSTIEAQRLQTVIDMISFLAAEHDLDTMLSKCMSYLVEALDEVENCPLILYDQVDGLLKVSAAQGYDPNLLDGLRLRPGEGICSKVFSQASPDLINLKKLLLPPERTCHRRIARSWRGRPLAYHDPKALSAFP